MNTRDLLIEIGTEELPPKALKRLSEAFTDGIVDGLKEAELGHGDISSFAAPRRLAVLIRNLEESQQDKTVEKRGPAIAAAYDKEGNPSKAAQGFARSCGVEVSDLERMQTDKGEWLVFRQAQAGQQTTSLVPAIVQNSLDRLPIPKRMRWGDLKAQFVRPVHWIVLLFGEEVIETELLSVKSGRCTRGHRFHHPQEININNPADYQAQLLENGYVIADFNNRRENVRAQVHDVAKSVNGNAVVDEALLDEVTSMVEWPVALIGNFDLSFLDIASEALISAMKGHQKYFHVVDNEGNMLPHFITVSNVDSTNMDTVREGNERVIRPRLSDAEFFWNQDRKQPLDSHLEGLKNVVFQNKLGSMHDKVMRVKTLASIIAGQLDGDTSAAERAAELAKCDLSTEMVGEFPDLQGIMGRYYARHGGETAEVADAIADHYRPRFAGDGLPASITGQSVSLADKLDTMVGIFGIGQAPTGDKDPFALRRAALGILRILIELDLDIDLLALIIDARELYNARHPGLIAESTDAEVFAFILGRLQVYYGNQDFSHDEIDSVVCLKPARLNDLDKRLRAVSAFRKLDEAESLSAANKRISNILKKSADGKIPSFTESMLQDEAEKTLAISVSEMQSAVAPMYESRDYESAMKKLAGLQADVDNFFDNVMVNVDDNALRLNRLALLAGLRNLFLQVADLSKLQ